MLKQRPDLTRQKHDRTRALMDEHVRDALVTGYETLIPSLTLPDPGDRHVLAAAIRAGADVIVTFNLKDFPTTAIAPYGIEAQHPDEFIAHLLDLAPEMVVGAARNHRQSLGNPPKSVEEYLDAIARIPSCHRPSRACAPWRPCCSRKPCVTALAGPTRTRTRPQPAAPARISLTRKQR